MELNVINENLALFQLCIGCWHTLAVPTTQSIFPPLNILLYMHEGVTISRYKMPFTASRIE